MIGVPDERWGERPLATVVVRDGEKVEVDELRDYLADKVAALAAAGALGVHRRGAEDLGRQVRQEGAAPAVRRGRAPGADPSELTDSAGVWGTRVARS